MSVIPRIGGTSRSHRLAKLDGRTKESRRLRQIEHDLIENAGGVDRISAAQKYLIERTSIDILRLELLDAEMVAGTLSAHDGRVAHALRNSVRLALRELGMKPTAAAPRGRLMADVRHRVRDAASGQVETLTIDPAEAYRAMCEGWPPPR